MMRLLLLGLALFLASRILGGLIKNAPTSEVKGESEKESLDLSEEDVQDIDFKEIK